MAKLIDSTLTAVGEFGNWLLSFGGNITMAASRTTTTLLAVALVTLVLHVSGVVSFPVINKWRNRGKTNKSNAIPQASWHDIHPTLPVKSVLPISVPDTKDVPTTQLAALKSYQESETVATLVQAAPHQTAATLHLLVLVHGFKGGAGDLQYLKSQVEQEFEAGGGPESSGPSPSNKLVVHAAKANEGLTDDGVTAGGERLVREIYDVMRQEIRYMEQTSAYNKSGNSNNNKPLVVTDVTLSFVGNSMGGLFSRYAAARIRDFALEEYQHICEKDQDTNASNSNTNMMTMFGRQLHYNIFCSTAAPHLGTASHTYIKLPRTVELGVAFALQQTGRDLFRLNNLLYNMATQPYYLDSLAAFRKRVAYANAYSTDFMVPTETAAFLNSESHTKHSFLDTQINNTGNPAEESDSYDSGNEEKVKHYRDNPLIVAALQTEKTYVPSFQGKSDTKRRESQTQPTEESKSSTEELSLQKETSELVEMATSLDSLGWKKVFIDFREDMPLKPLRLQSNGSASRNGDSSSSIVNSILPGFLTNNIQGGSRDASAPSTRAICQRMQKLRSRKEVESQDLVEVLSAKDKISVPLGHNMIVALKKTTTPKIMAVFNGLYQKGKPIMDSLAKELAEDSTLKPLSLVDGKCYGGNAGDSDSDNFTYVNVDNPGAGDGSTSPKATEAEALQ